jgi:hypothetical protein
MESHLCVYFQALGLNSGIQDADNLIWKLVIALKHQDHDCEMLLNSYDLERRPIGERVAKTSLYNMRAHALILDEAIGLSPAKSEAENVESMAQYFDLKDKENGLAKRQDVDKALQHLDVEFYAHGAEVGWFYDFDYNGTYASTDKAKNAQLKEDGEMELCTYHATTRPGSQLPHLWLIHRAAGERVSTRELVTKDKLTLLAMSPTWKAVEHPLIDIIIIGEHETDFLDSEGRMKDFWNGQMARTGALLVRPDNIIGYRFHDHEIMASPDVQNELQKIVQEVMRICRR